MFLAVANHEETCISRSDSIGLKVLVVSRTKNNTVKPSKIGP